MFHALVILISVQSSWQAEKTGVSYLSNNFLLKEVYMAAYRPVETQCSTRVFIKNSGTYAMRQAYVCMYVRTYSAL